MHIVYKLRKWKKLIHKLDITIQLLIYSINQVIDEILNGNNIDK
jgi:hypothetical protein